MKKNVLLSGSLKELIDNRPGVLGRNAFNLHLAENGREILELHSKKRMDLMVVDEALDDIPVHELCCSIRGDEELKKVSIIVATANGDEDMASKICSNAILRKPVEHSDLLREISRLVDVPPRKEVRVLLKVVVNGNYRDRPFYCTSHNISRSGILIETDRSLNQGDQISCMFTLPYKRHIMTEGEVVRVVSGSESNAYGVRFLSLAPWNVAAINDFVKSRESI